MKQRARGARQAAAIAWASEETATTRKTRGRRLGTRWALCFSIGFSLWSGPLGQARAEETTDPGAGRATLPAVAKPVKAEDGKLKAATALKSDKAKRPVAEAAPAPTTDAEAALVRDLHGGNEAAAVSAAQKLGSSDSPRAVDALLDVLALGVAPKVAGAALDALTAYKDKPPQNRKSQLTPELLQILSVYSHHRSPELRKRAYEGLAALIVPPAEPAAAAGKGPAKAPAKSPAKVAASAAPAAAAEAAQVVPMLVGALSDSSAEVRAVAANALGERREKSAEPALIKLLLRKDSAAPPALGKIGGADTARALSEMIGNVPDSFITETLGLLLLRPDFGPDPLRLDVVKTLGKMPGSQPIDILSDYMNETGKDKADKARPSRTEASKIIEQRTAK